MPTKYRIQKIYTLSAASVGYRVYQVLFWATVVRCQVDGVTLILIGGSKGYGDIPHGVNRLDYEVNKLPPPSADVNERRLTSTTTHIAGPSGRAV